MTVWQMCRDWRKILIYTHRWLGIALGLVLIMWFVSGIAMMYWRMPVLTAEERLMRMGPLDLSTVSVSPAEAARTLGLSPSRVRVAMLGDRPVYRFLTGGTWTAVYADTGEALGGMNADAAMALMRRFVPEYASALRYDAYLPASDQWTLTTLPTGLIPLHRFALNDPAGTQFYVSEPAGEVVMRTDAGGRFRGYWSSVVHLSYFPFLRRHRDTWNAFTVGGCALGAILCLTGLIAGIWRYSLNRRFRLKRVSSRSPYSGLLWWHHYAGLLFGLVSFTWSLSGMITLGRTPSFLEGSPETRAQREASTGGALSLDVLQPQHLRRAAAEVARSFTPKELDFVQFRGDPYWIAYRSPSADEIGGRIKISNFLALDLDREHVIVPGVQPENRAFRRFSDEDMFAVANAAMPGVPVRDAEWLDKEDGHYYHTWTRAPLPLPVLRVRYDDPQRTWLYLNPQHGLIALRNDSTSRAERWLQDGLHSLDFPFMYTRPLWDIIVIGLSLGGIFLCGTTLLPAVRRLRKRGRVFASSFDRFRSWGAAGTGTAGISSGREPAMRDTSP